jgi:hypothetical protein
MLCTFAHEFPPLVAEFLERDHSLKRHFREETITDLLMASMVMMGGRWLIVEFPDEPKTGADMQWDFVNEENNTYFSLLIQAKRLFGDGKNWRRHNYREILHTSGAGGQLQAQVLCDTARASLATVPIYMFYNPQQSCNLAKASGGPNVQGVNWAEGSTVRDLAVTATDRKLRTQNKSLAKLHPSLRPLSALLCPSGVLPLGIMGRAIGGRPPGPPLPLVFFRGGLGVAMPPRPEDIHQRLEAARERTPGTMEHAANPIKPSPLPEIAEIPDDVRARIIQHRSADTIEPVPGGLPHWRLTFRSRNTPSVDGLVDPQG